MARVLVVLLFVFLGVPAFALDMGIADTDAGTPDAGLVVADPAASRIEAIFGEIDGIRDVQITSRNGVVTLRGEVDSAKLRDDAEVIAARVEGVAYVQNQLTLKATEEPERIEKTTGDEAIQGQLNAIFAAVPALRDVRARVETGVVHLEGETFDPEAVKKAEELASSQGGVAFVDNQIVESVAVTDRLSPAWEKTKDVGQGILQRVPLFGLGFLVLLIFWLVARFIANRVPLSKLSDTPLARDFVRQLMRWAIVIMGLFVALEIWGVTSLVAALLGTAGIAGIGIGFAFKDIVENYLAGILLGMKQPFRQNDFVDIDGFQGKVIRLTSRETLLMTLDGNHLSLPNALVFKGVLYNFTRNPLRRFDFVVGVHPGEDFREVIRLGRATLASTPGVCAEPGPNITLDEFGDWTINVHFWAWVDQGKNGLFAVKSEAIRRVNEAFSAAGIDMPEQMQRVTLFQGTVAAPRPDRPEDDSPAIDISAADPVDDQIDVDRKETDEPNLLDA